MAKIPFKLKSGNKTTFKMMGSSPLEHRGDGEHPEHHKGDIATGDTRKAIDYIEDHTRQNIIPKLKDPVGTAKEGFKTAVDLASKPGGFWRGMDKLKEHFKVKGPEVKEEEVEEDKPWDWEGAR